MLKLEGVPVDVFKVFPSVPKDWRHHSKPNTAVLFSSVNYNVNWTLIVLVILIIVVFVITCLIYK